MELTEAIAQFAAGVKPEGIPAEVLQRAKRHVLDTLGVALAASNSTIAGILQQVVRGSSEGESSLWTGSGRSGAGDAAWLNGTIAHALDFDDGGVGPTPMHPSAPVLPAVLALAEARDLSGMDALCAYIVGVEIECKLANLVSLKHYERGWHTTAVLGTLGSAAASSRLLGLSSEKICHALGIAASMAGGLRTNFGSMTKPLHAGQAARNGLVAALLAEKGFTANRAALGADKGMVRVFELGDSVTGTEISTRLGRPFHFASPGVSIKRFPSCTSTHLTLEAILALRESHEFLPEQVEKIECAIHPLDYGVLLRPEGIQSPEQARFSAEFVLAAATLDGEVSLRHFNSAFIQRADVQGLMKRIHVYVPSDPAGLESTGNRFSLVAVHLSDGRVISHRATTIRGHPPLLLSDAEVDRKFLDCVVPVLAPQRAQIVLQALHGIDTAPCVADILSPFGKKL
ncbi:MAG TPA: MmgE/PrpD family protein [bacterium]|nr:MmgE/PrpD family protein [bacterium]